MNPYTLTLLALISLSGLSHHLLANPLITEMVSANDGSFTASNGEAYDWLELYNPTDDTIDLSGWHLTDSEEDLTQWTFPNGAVLKAGERRVVFAVGPDASAEDEPHWQASFRLSQRGETIWLVTSDGVTVAHELTFPAIPEGYSYGLNNERDEQGFFRQPTPENANGISFEDFVRDTKFNIDRGFFDAPFSLEITTATEGARIYYTTDGTPPGEGTIFTGPIGTLVEGPIRIDRTTVIRAIAVKANHEPSNIDTQTYIFLDDVIRQPKQPDRAPEKWGSRTADYEMDPDVVDDPAYTEELLIGLKSIPSMVITADPDDFFNNPDGIYANPGSDGRAWERKISLELIQPDGSAGFQLNAGIRIHGNGSRNPNGQPKHGFRVEFRSEYGTANLNYPLFPGSPVTKFDSLILRSQNAHGWTRNSQISNGAGTEREQSQYIRDSYARDLHHAMGQPGGEATYVHLYINGLYWGLYNPVEYPRAFHGAQHFGGQPEDYDAINRRPTTAGGKGTHAIDGTKEAWTAMQDLANSGLETAAKYAEMQQHMDLDNLIDYMLVHQYLGSRDGPEVFNSNNMRALRRSRGASPGLWHCYLWDMEASMFEIDVTRNINVDDPDTLVRVYTKLRENPEFLIRYADRVHRHFFNDGVLTPARAAAIWEIRAEEIFTAIVGESARWGDFRRPATPFTRDVEWAAERRRLLETYFPTRTDFLVKEFIKNGLYPSTKAPVFNQHGGAVPSGFELSMEVVTSIFNPQRGTIHYTVDGSDPRLAGGLLSPQALPYENPVRLTMSGLVRARLLDGDQWSALNEAYFYVDAVPASRDHLIISEIMPGSDMEFIELTNVSQHTVSLRELALVKIGDEGVNYTFDDRELTPGESVVLVNDRSRFDDSVPILGEWTGGSLDNSSETLTLMRGRETILSTTYEAAEEGKSLEFQQGAWIAAPPSPGRHGILSSAFEITSIEQLPNDTIRLTWPATEGASDRVEFSDSLHGDWQTEVEGISTGSVDIASTNATRFYRIVRP